MQTLTIEISNNKTLKLIEGLESLNLIRVIKDKSTKPAKKAAKQTITGSNSTTRSKKEREALLAKMNSLASKTDSSSFGDARNYQRKTRIDRKLTY